jgi:hypothetical protein
MAITYNSSSYTNENALSSSTVTWAHTCNVADKKLVVAVGGRATLLGITYNGVAMTLMANRNNDFSYEYTAVYYLDNPPTGASHNIVATYSAANTNRMGAAVGIGGCAPGFGAEADSISQAAAGVLVTQSITTTTANSDILFPFWRNNESSGITFGSGQILEVQNTANNGCFYIQKKSTTSAGLNSVTVTDSAAYNKVLIAIEILPATLLTNKNQGFFSFFK